MTPLFVSMRTRTKTVQREEVDRRPEARDSPGLRDQGRKAVAQDVEIETDVTDVRHELGGP